MSITRSRRLVPQAASGVRAGQYDGPPIGRRAKSLPLYRRVWSSVTARRSGKGGGAARFGAVRVIPRPSLGVQRSTFLSARVARTRGTTGAFSVAVRPRLPSPAATGVRLPAPGRARSRDPGEMTHRYRGGMAVVDRCARLVSSGCGRSGQQIGNEIERLVGNIETSPQRFAATDHALHWVVLENGSSSVISLAIRVCSLWPLVRHQMNVVPRSCGCSVSLWSVTRSSGRRVANISSRRIHQRPATPMEARVLLRPAIRRWHPGCHWWAARQPGVRPLPRLGHSAGRDRPETPTPIGSSLIPRNGLVVNWHSQNATRVSAESFLIITDSSAITSQRVRAA